MLIYLLVGVVLATIWVIVAIRTNIYDELGIADGRLEAILMTIQSYIAIVIAWPFTLVMWLIIAIKSWR